MARSSLFVLLGEESGVIICWPSSKEVGSIMIHMHLC